MAAPHDPRRALLTLISDNTAFKRRRDQIIFYHRFIGFTTLSDQFIVDLPHRSFRESGSPLFLAIPISLLTIEIILGKGANTLTSDKKRFKI